MSWKVVSAIPHCRVNICTPNSRADKVISKNENFGTWEFTPGIHELINSPKIKSTLLWKGYLIKIKKKQ